MNDSPHFQTTRPRTQPGPEPGVRLAAAADLPAVIAVLAAALDDTEIAHWLVPDDTERVQVYRRYFALVTPWFFDKGTVYVTDDRSAAALWARVDSRFEPDIADYGQQLVRACGAATGRFVQLDLAMHASHWAQLPHHYLAFLAVAPARQGQGIGSRLLHAHHDLVDRDRLPSYLEATGHRNADLYARHGYLREQPLPIGDGPPLYPMVRWPQ